jgi:hypothetical protein
VQKYANLVDLENPEKMSIWSLSELSIQPRTSLLKFEGDFISSFIRLLRKQPAAYSVLEAAPRDTLQAARAEQQAQLLRRNTLQYQQLRRKPL